MSLIALLLCRKRCKKGSKPRASMNIRVWAAFVFMMVHLGLASHKELPTLWAKWDGAEHFTSTHSKAELKRLSKRWGSRFLEGGSMRDLPRRQKPRQVPLEEARLAAWYLKSGHWMVVPGTNHRKAEFVHRYYTSLDMACQHCPELMAIRQKYNVTNRAFFKAMRKADPMLVQHTVRLRYQLKKSDKKDRQTRATSLYSRCLGDPTFLERVYFIDECGIVIDNVLKKGVKVYTDAHDEGYKHVIHTQNVHNGSRIKLHILAAVNAVHGAFHLEFTTGTTDIERQYNMLPLSPQWPGYMVSAHSWSLN